MSDLIITQQGNAEILKRIRSPKVTINNPESGNKSVTFLNVEAKYLDGEFEGEVVKDRLHKVITNEVMMEDVVFTSPVDGEEKTLKVAEIMIAIQSAYVNWYNNREEGEVRPTRETVVGGRNQTNK